MRRVFVSGYHLHMTTTRVNHTGHNHPSTTAARTACRHAMATTTPELIPTRGTMRVHGWVTDAWFFGRATDAWTTGVRVTIGRRSGTNGGWVARRADDGRYVEQGNSATKVWLAA